MKRLPREHKNISYIRNIKFLGTAFQTIRDIRADAFPLRELAAANAANIRTKEHKNIRADAIVSLLVTLRRQPLCFLSSGTQFPDVNYVSYVAYVLMLPR